MPSPTGRPPSRIAPRLLNSTLAASLWVACGVRRSQAQAVGPRPQPTDTVIFRDGFESGDLSRWEQDPQTGRYSVTTDPAHVRSGTHALEVLYTPTNSWGMILRRFMPGYDEIYVRFSVLFEAGFEHAPHFLTVCGNTIHNSGSCYGKAGVVPNGTDFFYAGVDPEYVGDDSLRPLSFYTYWPDMPCCYGHRLAQTEPKIPLIGGRWQEVVFHIKMNTPGQDNAYQELWVDGVKKIVQRDMRWRTTTDLRLNMVRFDNWMARSPKTQHLWIDDVTIWRP